MKNKRRWIITLLALLLLAAASVLWCNITVSKAASGKCFTEVENLPHKHAALLLGTGKYAANGLVNLYYSYRIDAADALMKSGKADVLIISGDNSTKEYNEPQMMKDDLIARGIDSTKIYLDYAGFRTYDSMVRLKEIFGQSEVVIISQRFHNERALFIADGIGIDAVAFDARDVEGSNGTLTQIREKLARVKVYLDFLFGVDPKFLGKKEEVK